MAELKASVRLDFRDPLGDAPFELSIDEADGKEQRHAFYKPLGSPQSLQGAGFHERKQKLLTYGYATIRLYAPAGNIPEVLSLDPLTETETEEANWGILKRIFFKLRPSGFDGEQIVYLGRREAEQIEALEFSNSRETRIRYWYDSPNIEVLHQSEFINSDGQPATPPSLRPGGRFVAAEPVYGAMLVKYTTEYFAYRVFYDVPTNALMWQTSEDGESFIPVKPPEPPPVRIYAQKSGRISLFSVPRPLDVLAYTSHHKMNFKGAKLGTEMFKGTEDPEGTKTKDVVVEDPNDPSVSVTVKRYQQVTFIDDSGQKLVLKLADK